MWPDKGRESPFYTVKTVFREVPLTVIMRRKEGTVLSVETSNGSSITSLLSDDQLHELAVQVREEGE